MVKTIVVDGVVLNVVWEFEGGYYPATRIDPEEYPDLVIGEVYAGDGHVDIYDLLSSTQLEFIYDEIYKNGYE